mmetsp:Transcript_11582/g.42353  ORF Transcript_11582/g.42353 Transcript_11582/m.42353 type:complete len:135 (-) Transcript_11582:1275-1679(-)
MMGMFARAQDLADGVEFWHSQERTGWLMKQGAVIKTWRRRFFVLKQGKIFWFKDDNISSVSKPRGVIDISQCLSVKGAEDVINRPHSFEISTQAESNYYIADTDKEKEDWINAIGRAIVRHSRSMADREVLDYS